MAKSGLGVLRVLVVDDNRNTQILVKTVLESLGVGEVVVASEGAEALQTLKRHRCDFAVVDYLMPGADGADLTRQVRTDGSDTYLPIIMMTGHSDRIRVGRARDAGVTEIITKPLVVRSLLDRMNAIIDRPRPFVRSVAYFGPDRRRRKEPDYQGPERRTIKPSPAQ